MSLVFVLDALTFVLAALFLLGITVPKHAPEEEESVRTVLGDIRIGMGYLFDSPMLRAVLFIFSGLGLSLGAINTVSLPFVLSELSGGSEFVYGVYEGAMSAGFVIGSLLMAGFAARLKERSWITLSILGTGGAALVYALSDSVPLIIALGSVFGLFNAPFLIAAKTVFQRSTPRNLRGRVIGVLFVTTDAMIVLGLLAGGFGDVIGIRTLIIVAGMFTLLLGLLALGLPGLRTAPPVDDEEEDEPETVLEPGTRAIPPHNLPDRLD